MLYFQNIERLQRLGLCQSVDAITSTVDNLTEIAAQKVTQWKTAVETNLREKSVLKEKQTRKRLDFQLYMGREGEKI